MSDYVYLIPLFPLLGVLINGLFGYRLPKRIIGLLGCLTILASFVGSALLFFEVVSLPPSARSLEKTFYSWIPVGELQVNIGFLIDPLSLVMLLVVSGVGFLIHIYSVGYMKEDEGYPRYFAYLNLFVFFMLLLVSANSFLLLFVGWEGVGLCSYLLIGFWYQRKAPADAGKKAFIVNRIGDYGFLLGMLLIFATFSSLNFKEVFQAASLNFSQGSLLITVITLLLFIGACGKSAQLPLYVWLPDAMEGPTPVSALIHAATMVTAGVYMVARVSPLYLLSPVSMEVVAIVGALTAFFAASIGMAQNDIKRVLAYSTISQLGYMFLALGVGAFSAGIFHLMTHAFFKALLFLGAGSVMHALSGELNMQKMGGLKTHLPKTYFTFFAATLAIAGIFPFAGFFSKDEILWGAFQKNTFLWAFGLFTAFLTAFYMFRALFLTFHGKPRLEEHLAKHLHESPPVMINPLIVLAFLSLIGGWVGLPLLKGGNQFKEFLAPVLGGGEAHHGSFELEVSLMVLSLGVAILGILLAHKLYLKDPTLPQRITNRFKALYTLIYNKYYVDELYSFLVVEPLREFSNFLWLNFDDQVIDGGVNGAGRIINGLSSLLRRIQSGYVQHYALSILGGIVAILAYYIFR